MNPQVSGRRVCMVGAGYISQVHAEALRDLSIPVVAVVDPNEAAAHKLAMRWSIPHIFGSVDEALAGCAFGRAHIVVPPDMHESVAVTLAQKQVAVLVEKPLATTSTACDNLIAAVSEPSKLAVNLNFVFHPAFVRLKKAVRNFELGGLRHVSVVYHAPLRQLVARQFGHWMFRDPINILLEQAVHPLSLVTSVCGAIGRVNAIGGPVVELAPGAHMSSSFTAGLECEKAHASFRFEVGQVFPCWQISAYCDDGMLTADILANRMWTLRRTRWMESVDHFASGHASAASVIRDSWKNMIEYGLSTVKATGRKDGFFVSMAECIGAFHRGVDDGIPTATSGAIGKHVVEVCESIASQILPSTTGGPRWAPTKRTWRPDVAVVGGTGFIGTALVARLRKAGMKVRVLARNLDNLPAIFRDPNVALHRGTIASATDVETTVEDAPFVVNLAHGGGGETPREIEDAMVGGAKNVAASCLASGRTRLIHVGSIASLYLGPQAGVVTGSTSPDEFAHRRASYARAKALCDRMLMQMHVDDRLPVCIIRPGLVVGPGTSPLHSGLGFFNNEQHCVGWNDGRNPLPFVLVSDVAEALCLAGQSEEIVGKCYNLAGDVRPSAREYLARLAVATKRPFAFHGNTAFGLYVNEMEKWLVKQATGRKSPPPYLHDLLSRGLRASFDCSDAKHDLGWSPVSDAEVFYEEAFRGFVSG